jgi:ribosomal-protein-alanine N-acetyltransferase
VDGDLVVRPLRMRDAAAWSEMRLANEEWLRPWEPTVPESFVERNTIAAYSGMLRVLRRQARTGTHLPFGIEVGGRLVGQLMVGNIVHGAYNGAYLGYWVDSRFAGRGICPHAVALVVDHCFGAAGLHRIEVNIRPENAASRRVVEKLGFRVEGMFARFLNIDGAYRDHVHYALTAEDVPEGLLHRWSLLAT